MCVCVASPYFSPPASTPSHPPYTFSRHPLSYTQRTLIQQSAYVLCASGTRPVQTCRRVISLCFVQIAASDDGNLIPTEHRGGGCRGGCGCGDRTSRCPVARRRVPAWCHSHAHTPRWVGKRGANTPNC